MFLNSWDSIVIFVFLVSFIGGIVIIYKLLLKLISGLRKLKDNLWLN